MTILTRSAVVLLAAMICVIGHAPVRAPAQDIVAENSLARLPVREITVFKDGHAFLLHEGTLPTDQNGNIHLDSLPTPVIGTFWPYSADPDVGLKGVVAGKMNVELERTALNVREMLHSNLGAKVLIREGERSYAATIVDIPERDRDEIERLDPNDASETSHVPGEVIILQTAEGYKVVPIGTIQDVIYLDEPNTSYSREERRNLLTLQLDWPDEKPRERAQVGMMYLQKGIRWIPHYRVTLNDDGTARLQLQATILNEMVDLDGVTANLVVGVPSFYFKETIDPIALTEQAAQLTRYFQTDSQSAYAMSNSMMTQLARSTEHRVARAEPRPVDVGPDVAEGDKQEDLYIFTVEDLSLKKGERMVVPVAEITVPYRDVFTLEVPMLPPPELRQNFNSQQQEQLAHLFHAPKVSHKLRLANNSNMPLTTCPAIIMQNDRLLGQGLMTYTAAGGSVDLEVTQAVDIQASKAEEELKRTPNATTWANHSYDRVDLSGEIKLTNYRSESSVIYVTRYVMGHVDRVGGEGQARAVNLHEEGWNSGSGSPPWWRWGGWYGWWFHLNAASRLEWKVELEPGETVKLDYKWHYFWRG